MLSLNPRVVADSTDLVEYRRVGIDHVRALKRRCRDDTNARHIDARVERRDRRNSADAHVRQCQLCAVGNHRRDDSVEYIDPTETTQYKHSRTLDKVAMD